MIRSMTGFGAAERRTAAGTVTVELRSVNSRHLKINFRLPAGTEKWEIPLRALIAEGVRRGHVDVSVRVELEHAGGDGTGAAYRIDEARVDAYVRGLRELKDRYGLAGEVDLSLVGRCDRVLVEYTPELMEIVPIEDVEAVTQQALSELIEMRRREGERLAVDLRTRLREIGKSLDEVAAMAPARLDAERERLRRSVDELTAGVPLEEDRLAREIAILADRWDVGEELVRARSHLEAFEELLQAPDGEPVGKRLGFLSQELLREINTIGAKANDAQIARRVVEAKNELESLREQVENVE